MKKTYIGFAFVGMGIGFPATLACMTLIGGFNAVIAGLFVWMVASALYGVLSGVIFHRKNDLPLPAAIALHCLGCMLITIAAAAVCGYADSFTALLTGVLPVFIVVYAVIYLGIFLSMKREEQKVNEALNRK